MFLPSATAQIPPRDESGGALARQEVTAPRCEATMPPVTKGHTDERAGPPGQVTAAWPDGRVCPRPLTGRHGEEADSDRKSVV